VDCKSRLPHCQPNSVGTDPLSPTWTYIVQHPHFPSSTSRLYGLRLVLISTLCPATTKSLWSSFSPFAWIGPNGKPKTSPKCRSPICPTRSWSGTSLRCVALPSCEALSASARPWSLITQCFSGTSRLARQLRHRLKLPIQERLLLASADNLVGPFVPQFLFFLVSPFCSIEFRVRFFRLRLLAALALITVPITRFSVLIELAQSFICIAGATILSVCYIFHTLMIMINFNSCKKLLRNLLRNILTCPIFLLHSNDGETR